MKAAPAPRALVVDDDADIRTLVEWHLRRLGFETRTAGDGDAALAVADEHVPDLVTLDVRMPGRNGFDVVRELRLRGSRAAVLLLSASVGPEDVEVGLQAGADAYLKKPFSRADLLGKVIELMETKETA